MNFDGLNAEIEGIVRYFAPIENFKQQSLHKEHDFCNLTNYNLTLKEMKLLLRLFFDCIGNTFAHCLFRRKRIHQLRQTIITPYAHALLFLMTSIGKTQTGCQPHLGRLKYLCHGVGKAASVVFMALMW